VVYSHAQSSRNASKLAGNQAVKHNTHSVIPTSRKHQATNTVVKMDAITPTSVARPIVIAIITIVILYMISRQTQGKKARLLPPGPTRIPLFGNINDLPKPGILECHHWLKHKDLYGPISSVTVLGQTIVLIHDPAIAFELLRDRSAIHSSRPSQVFSCEM
jgi:hypothetical protein